MTIVFGPDNNLSVGYNEFGAPTYLDTPCIVDGALNADGNDFLTANPLVKPIALGASIVAGGFYMTIPVPFVGNKGIIAQRAASFGTTADEDGAWDVTYSGTSGKFGAAMRSKSTGISRLLDSVSLDVSATVEDGSRHFIGYRCRTGPFAVDLFLDGVEMLYNIHNRNTNTFSVMGVGGSMGQLVIGAADDGGLIPIAAILSNPIIRNDFPDNAGMMQMFIDAENECVVEGPNRGSRSSQLLGQRRM